ncbi:MAG: C1 family peptidase [Ignavibacteria bacterium]
MKYREIMFLFILSLLLCNSIAAQEQYGLGVLLDSALYVNAPVKAPLTRGDYTNMPKAHSLKKYCPAPGNQGQTGTCAAWSSAYACRTILEAIKYNYTGPQIDKNAFSPSFVYNQVRSKKNCNDGTSLLDILNVLKAQGGVKLSEFAFDCNREVTQQDRSLATDHRIIEYREVASKYEGKQSYFVKKSISENNPVVIAMDVPPSFNKAGQLWHPDTSDYKRWSRGHGMAVVGYDDSKFGGAFEIMNSWGTYWGNGGFTWITYKDFEFFVMLAFELIDKPVNSKSEPDLSGKLFFRESSYEPMKAGFNGEYFVTRKSYASGTLFELLISNDQPAYVYAISSDSTFKVEKLFPFNKNMVAYLPYKKNNVSIPSEDTYNMLDDVKGSSYYCFLYSKKEIDIDAKITAIENSKGSFWERIKFVFGNDLVPSSRIIFSDKDEISFSAFSEKESVVPVLVEINHE